MPRLKKVAPARTVADVDAGLIAVAQAYRAELATKRAEYTRVAKLLAELAHDVDVLHAKVTVVDNAVGAKVFNANL